MAAALCREQALLPRDLLSPERLPLLQRRLLRAGQYIPGLTLDDPDDPSRRRQRLEPLAAGQPSERR